jgi:hypothetical protein
LKYLIALSQSNNLILARLLFESFKFRYSLRNGMSGFRHSLSKVTFNKVLPGNLTSYFAIVKNDMMAYGDSSNNWLRLPSLFLMRSVSAEVTSGNIKVKRNEVKLASSRRKC